MKKLEEIKYMLSSFFRQVTPEQMDQARAKTGIGYIPRGTLNQLLDDQSYSIEDLVILLLADTVTRQKELENKSERLAQLETLCSRQQKAIDDIANQSFKLRSLVAKISPDQEAISSFDILKNVVQRVEDSQ
ncbi:MAG: hypothetical protein ABJ360_03645 [Roseobacter sp.]